MRLCNFVKRFELNDWLLTIACVLIFILCCTFNLAILNSYIWLSSFQAASFVVGMAASFVGIAASLTPIGITLDRAREQNRS